MSLHITVYTDNYVVMGSDSRSSWIPDDESIPAHFEDTAEKLIKYNDYIGISFSGHLEILHENKVVKINDHLLQFRNDNVGVNDIDILSNALLRSFDMYNQKPETYFHVAGYDKNKKSFVVYKIDVKNRHCNKLDTTINDGIYDGSVDVLNNMLRNNELNGDFSDLTKSIEFIKNAIIFTAEREIERHGIKTVGGPIDILAIKPTGAFWIQRKELHA